MEKVDKSSSLHITGFLRPFTLKQAREMVNAAASSDCGELLLAGNDGFSMDKFKTCAWATFSTINTAEKARAALNGRVWPEGTGRALRATFTSCEARNMGVASSTNQTASIARKRHQTKIDRTDEEKRLRQKAMKALKGAKKPSHSSIQTPAETCPPQTISDIFFKTSTKPVIYFLPLTKEEVEAKRRKQTQKRARRR